MKTSFRNLLPVVIIFILSSTALFNVLETINEQINTNVKSISTGVRG